VMLLGISAKAVAQFIEVPSPSTQPQNYRAHARGVKELFEAHKELNKNAKIIDEALGGTASEEAKGFEQLMDQIVLGFLGIPEIAKALKHEPSNPKELPSLRINITTLNGVLMNARAHATDKKAQKVIGTALKQARRMQRALPDAETTVDVQEMKKQ